MEYTIKKMAEISGVSPRTLRFYDQIHLLKPSRVTESGYRIYTSQEVDRLQQILFYRSLDFKLEQIAEILDNPAFDHRQALIQHQEMLQEERKQFDTLLMIIQYILESYEGGKSMKDHEKFEGFKKQKIMENETNYGQEIREKYGDDTVEKANKKWQNMSEEKFEEIIKKYPEVLKCIPLLLAVRANEIYAIDADGEFRYNFKKANLSVEQYKIFMKKTGLFDLLSNHIINNLVDYATGVETGLDSNGRKNRGGHLMEDLVESFIIKAGFIKNKNYFKEMYIHEITDKWNIDLSAISNSGKTEKRFDFVVKTENMIYGIETNFYGSQGSKLNETARSYKTLALEIDTIEEFTFVWFTDGKGWKNAKNNLEETFDVMEHIYNIKDLENGIMTEVFK